jgi:iron(II)-dependent oxidoreductase
MEECSGMGSQTAPAPVLTPEAAVEALQEARERTLALVAPIADADLERVHSTLMSPLVWDLGHIAAFEDLWLVHRFGELELLRDDLMDVYDAFETPRAERGELPFLRPEAARTYLAEVRERTLDLIAERGVADGLLHELVIRHEMQHNETMLQTLQLAQLEGYELATVLSQIRAGSSGTGLEFVSVPAGPAEIGARAAGFAYDNERPRHRTDVRGYLIAKTPVTNASYLTFVEGGGYERREWWSDEGWAWKEQYDITRPAGWTAGGAEQRLGRVQPLDPDAPVTHVSWFEADAFARAHGARLPTELEWEKAATWNQAGSEIVPGVSANLDHVADGPIGGLGTSASGIEGMIGDVWEWTSSSFGGYPGFVAHPYREYSEVFFGSDYKVLRGGSWATRARVASATFRNWDYPQRRQIFSGFRLAKDGM